MKELFEQFERQAIDANYPISFSKSDGNRRYFYYITQSMFEGWLLHYRSSNIGNSIKILEDVLEMMDSFKYEKNEDRPSNSFFEAELNEDGFFILRHEIESFIKGAKNTEQQARAQLED